MATATWASCVCELRHTHAPRGLCCMSGLACRRTGVAHVRPNRDHGMATRAPFLRPGTESGGSTGPAGMRMRYCGSRSDTKGASAVLWFRNMESASVQNLRMRAGDRSVVSGQRSVRGARSGARRRHCPLTLKLRGAGGHRGQDTAHAAHDMGSGASGTHTQSCLPRYLSMK